MAITVEEELVHALVAELVPIRGVVAVVLGGSRARDLARPDSDVDVGLYYSDARPIAVDDVRRVAQTLHAAPSPVVSDLYEWGPWVNGGAWLTIDGTRVDLLYRSIEHVRRAISDAEQGIVQHDWAQQPPYGFFSVIYLGEIACCRPLHDPMSVVRDLKAAVATYPRPLKARIVGSYLWLAEFTIANARGMAASGDVYTVVGCLTRCAAYLTQVLFALNDTYFVSDKTALREIATFGLQPRDYGARLSRLLASPGDSPRALRASVAEMVALFDETVALAGDLYRARYRYPDGE